MRADAHHGKDGAYVENMNDKDKKDIAVTDESALAVDADTDNEINEADEIGKADQAEAENTEIAENNEKEGSEVNEGAERKKHRSRFASMSKGKRITLISVCAAALVIAIVAIVLVMALGKDYLEKTDYDHVASTSYNGVRIVGEDGLLYLEKNGEKVSAGYISLKSVNDYYGDIALADSKTDGSITLFDYYIAKKADSSAYCLVTSVGEEFVIVGDNYSLESVSLPYIIFVNNTNSRKAAVSLFKIDSDLSKKSNNDLTLRTFASLQPVAESDSTVLNTYMLAMDDTVSGIYSVFLDDGTLVASSEDISVVEFKKPYPQEGSTVYFSDNENNRVYSARGILLAEGTEPMRRVSDRFGVMMSHDEKTDTDKLFVFSHSASFSIGSREYDLTAAVTYGGGVAVPKLGNGYSFFSAATGESIDCSEPTKMSDSVLCAASEDGSSQLYMTDGAELLIDTEYGDLALNVDLSANDIYVFESPSLDASDTSKHSYYFTKAGKEAVMLSFDASSKLSLLYESTDTYSVRGSYKVETPDSDGGAPELRICTPFAPNPLSDPYDTVDTYLQAGVYWSRCASFDRGVYEIIDPVSNQKAGSIACKGEDFAKLHFRYEGYDTMAVDPYDSESGVPLLLFSISIYDDDSGMTSNVRYFALYRATNVGASEFDKGVLRISEVGMNLLRSQPYKLFGKDNCLVLYGTGSSKVFSVNSSNVLVETASIPYHVTDIMYDTDDPAVFYYVVTSDEGFEGLYDKDGNQILAPYYDRISYVCGAQYVVSLRGAAGVLENRGGNIRQLIDYRYTYIHALSDGAYVATDGNGDAVIYDGKKVVTDEPIQSYLTVKAYSVAEDGSLQIRYDELFSVDGDLYMHEGERTHRSKCAEFETHELGCDSIGNERALIVSYWSESGDKITATEIVYPSEYYRNAFALATAPNDAGWFLSDIPEEQTDAVTKEQLLEADTHMISLYPKR